MLLTNDGDLMQRMTRPGSAALKVYDVVVGGVPRETDLDKLRGGAELDGRHLMPCEIELIERLGGDGPAGDSAASPTSTDAAQRGFTRLRVTLREGKN